MNHQLSWSTPLFEEMSSIYQRAKQDPQIKQSLEQLEERALQEVEANRDLLEKLSRHRLPSSIALNHVQKETAIYLLGQAGLNRFE